MKLPKERVNIDTMVYPNKFNTSENNFLYYVLDMPALRIVESGYPLRHELQIFENKIDITNSIAGKPDDIAKYVNQYLTWIYEAFYLLDVYSLDDLSKLEEIINRAMTIAREKNERIANHNLKKDEVKDIFFYQLDEVSVSFLDMVKEASARASLAKLSGGLTKSSSKGDTL